MLHALVASSLALALPAEHPAEQLTAQLKRAGSQIERIATVKDLRLIRDAARFELRTGHFYFLGRVGDRSIAVVFIGEGHLDLHPPLAVERAELRRLMGDTTLSTDFASAAFVFADSTAEELSRLAAPVEPAATVDGDERGQVRRRMDEALDYLIDRDTKLITASILSALLNGTANGYFSAWVTRTGAESFFVELDPVRPEAISVSRKGRHPGQTIQTVTTWPLAAWVDSSTPPPFDPLEVRAYDIESTVRGNLAYSASCAMTVVVRNPGERWFELRLTSFLDVDSVTDRSGRPLAWHRSPGKTTLWIQLDSMVRPDTETVVRLRYHGPLLQAGSLLRLMGVKTGTDPRDPVVHDRWVFLKSTWSWFPRHGTEPADFALTFHTPADLQFATIGRQLERRVDGKVLTTRWVSEHPTAHVSFNLGDFEEFTVEDPRIPPVIVQLNAEAHRQLASVMIERRNAAQEVGSDVANSLSFFSRVFGPPLFSRYYATEIPYGHGQAFPGLMHLSWWTFQTLEQKGESEMFRAHEMAHQWWGIGVAPRGYRDWWIAEGFAAFSGLWYMQLILRDNEKYFKHLDDWRKELLGLKNAPPLGIGSRVGDANPAAYAPIVYRKGAWVLHMIRNMMLNLRTMNEDAFQAAMADFYRTHRGGTASTGDFRDIMEKHFGAGLGWFFDQWFDETAYPTYILSWRTEPKPDGTSLLRMRVRQEGVPETFLMPVPLRIVYDDGSESMIRLNVKGREVTGELPTPKAAVRLELNPLQSVLAEVKEEKWKEAPEFR